MFGTEDEEERGDIEDFAASLSRTTPNALYGIGSFMEGPAYAGDFAKLDPRTYTLKPIGKFMAYLGSEALKDSSLRASVSANDPAVEWYLNKKWWLANAPGTGLQLGQQIALAYMTGGKSLLAVLPMAMQEGGALYAEEKERLTPLIGEEAAENVSAREGIFGAIATATLERFGLKSIAGKLPFLKSSLAQTL